MSRFIAPFLALLIAPSVALGDGMVMYHVEVGEAELVPVEADVQRAVLWHRDGTWELTIQPAFPRSGGNAAWVVPFPVVPKVEPRDAAFMDQLETFTAPIFVPHCVERDGNGWFGCGAAVAEGETVSGEVGRDVRIWDAGVTDELDYVVLEATGAAALINWLDENGYRVPQALEDEPELLDGQVVFAAKLLADLAPDSPLSPLSFRLPGLSYDAITYPLRLTALVAPDEGMELLLWVVTDDQALVPGNVPWLPYSGGNSVSRTRWEANIETIHSAFPPSGGLILEYAGTLQGSPIHTGAEVYPPGPSSGVTAAGLGLDLPETWGDEILEIINNGDRVVRFRGVLTAAAMAQDLAFDAIPVDELPGVVNFFWDRVSCESIEGGSEATVSRASPWLPAPVRKRGGVVLVALGCLAGLLVLRRLS